MPTIIPRTLVLVLLSLSLFSTAGCNGRKTVKNFDEGAPAATAPAQTAPKAAPAVTPQPTSVTTDKTPEEVPDPLYYWNLTWFTFNDVFYGKIMRPFARGYALLVPKIIRTGLSNAYNNFTFPIRFVNALLQLDFVKASREFGRFMLNSTFGVGGLVDVAKSDPDLQPGNEDFGQTLGHYGMPEGFYIVWPLLGPSTLRDSIGLAGDAVANPLFWLFAPWAYGGDEAAYWYWPFIIKAADVFNNLPDTLEALDAVTKPAIEPYTAIKDAYIQYRRNAVAH